jgi:hypothetical protein
MEGHMTRRALLVVGMHRSGTSLTAALLCMAGVDAPAQLMGPNESNETGYWESWPFYHLNEEVLGVLGSSWDSTLTLPGRFWESPGLAPFKERFADMLRVEYGDSALFCVKDPRVSRLLPLWEPVLRSQGIEPSYLITVRNPIEVAQSLKRRDGFHRSKSYVLWLRHILEAERNTRGRRRVFVTYDQLMHDWRGVLQRASDALLVPWPRRLSEIDVRFEAIIADRLRHHSVAAEDIDARDEIPVWVKRAYLAALSAATDNEEAQLSTFDAIRAELDTADTAFEPLTVTQRILCTELEAQASAARAEADALRGETETLSCELKLERDGLGERLQAESLQAAAARAETEAQRVEVEALRTRAGALQSEIDTSRSQADADRREADSLRGQIAAKETALEAMHAELGTVRAELEAREAELSQIVTALRADLERTRAELDAQRTETGTLRNQAGALSSDAAAARAALEQARMELEDSKAQSEVMRQEAASLRGETAATKTELEGARAQLASAGLAADGARAEIAALQDELASLHAQFAEADAARAQIASARAEETAELSAVLMQRDAEANSLREQVEVTRHQLAAGQSQADELRNALTRASDERSVLAGRLRQHDEEASALHAELVELRAALSVANAREAEAAERASRMAARAAMYVEQLRDAQEDAEAASRECIALCRRLESEGDRLAALESELASATAAAQVAREALADRDHTLETLRLESAELRKLASALQACTQTPERTPQNGSAGFSHDFARADFATKVPLASGTKMHRSEPSVDALASNLCNINEWRIDLEPRAGGGVEFSGQIGVFAHICEDGLAREMAGAISNIPFAFHVYVSTPDESRKAAIAATLKAAGIKEYTIKVLPDVGRDVGSFILGFGNELDRHEICLRLHSGKSTHVGGRLGAQWRHVLESLLTDPERVSLVVDSFGTHPELGMIIPRDSEGIVDAAGMRGSWKQFRKLLARMEIAVDPNAAIEFPRGSMFWFRSAALTPLLKLNFTNEEFRRSEERDGEFTIARALERSLLFSSAKAGLSWAWAPKVNEIQPLVEYDTTSIALSQQQPPENIAECQQGPGYERNRDIEIIAPLFDIEFYRKQCPELEASVSPQEHYLSIGVYEGKSPHVLFDTSYYLATQPDVAESGTNPLLHFLQFGWRERRDPHPLFHIAYYLRKYPHVERADVNPLLHFLEFGCSEGLNPNSMFDSTYYLESNPDVRAARVNPLVHFIEHGAREGRNPHPTFDTLQYLNEHPGIRDSGLNPLTHYFRSYQPERRQSQRTKPEVNPRQKRSDGLFAVERLYPVVKPASSFEPRRTVLCVTHVPPYPPRAGNEYGEYRQLAYLEQHGYRIILLLSPLPGDELSADRIRALCDRFPYSIVCERDGTLLHGFPDGDAVVQMLDGTRPEPLAPEVGEDLESESAEISLINQERTFCPDFLARLALHLESALAPCVVLSQYIFQTRFLPLIRSNSLKVIQTHDMFSTMQRKVVQLGVADVLNLTPHQERRRLLRADVILSCQRNEALAFGDLVPERKVLEIPLDFDVAEHVKTAEGSTILYVASDNALNTKGLRDFLDIAWPLVLKDAPKAELLVVGKICRTVDFAPENVRLLGLVDSLDPLYEQAKLTINPSVAGTGLKIKNAEALSRLRPVVSWPAGVDGFQPELADLCHVAYNWPQFAAHIVRILRDPRKDWFSAEQRAQIRHLLSPDTIYKPVLEYLDTYCDWNQLPSCTTSGDKSQS